MADAGLFLGWGAVPPGREQKALQVFDEVLRYYTRLQQQGELESFEPVLLEPHGGDLSGFVLLRGDAERLARLRTSEEFVRLTTRAGLVVADLGVVGAFLGEGLTRQLASYRQQATDLA